MPESSPTTPPGLLLATDLRACSGQPIRAAGQLTNQLSHSLATLTVHHVPAAPGDLRLWRRARVECVRARRTNMNEPKIALRLCARRYLSHCPEG